MTGVEAGVGVLTLMAGAISLLRQASLRPPLWRVRLAFAGASVCLLAAAGLVAADASALVATPLLLVMALAFSEWAFSLLSLWAAAGRPSPKWLL